MTKVKVKRSGSTSSLSSLTSIDTFTQPSSPSSYTPSPPFRKYEKKKVKVKVKREEEEEPIQTQAVPLSYEDKVGSSTVEKVSRDFHLLPHDQSYHEFDKHQVSQFQTTMLDWYQANRRELPWRLKLGLTSSQLFYRVLLSEFMLQQTQVTTVIQYFETWLQVFPSLEACASASQEQVFQVWAGLGYYNRAKNFHQVVKSVVADKKLPDSFEKLIRFKGIGKYTANAVASIVFDLPCAAVDTNILRVICRVVGINNDIKLAKVVKGIDKFAKRFLDTKSPGEFNQSYMDFATAICKPKNPSCSLCPFSKKDPTTQKVFCKSFQESLVQEDMVLDMEDILLKKQVKVCELCDMDLTGITFDHRTQLDRYPFKTKLKKPKLQISLVLIIQRYVDNLPQYFLTQNLGKGLFSHLQTFPTLQLQPHLETNLKVDAEVYKLQFQPWVQLQPNQTINFVGEVQHRFSHIQMTYKTFQVDLDHLLNLNLKGKFVGNVESFGLPTAYLKILKLL